MGPLLASALVSAPLVDLPRTRSLVVPLEATPRELAPGDRVDVLVTRDGVASTVLEAAHVVSVETLGVTVEVAWHHASPFLQALDDGHASVLRRPHRRLGFLDHFLISGPRDSL